MIAAPCLCIGFSLMASVMTSEFVKTSHQIEAPPFSLLEQKSLVVRLAEEISRTAIEIARDPRRFMRDLFTDDTLDRKRQRRMRALLASALAFHLVLLGVIVIIGWHALKKSGEPAYTVKFVEPVAKGSSVDTPDAPKLGKSGDGKSGSGSPGGGGQNDPRPVNKGVPPPSVPNPVFAKFAPPNAPPPLLAIPQTIQGPQSPAPASDAPIGLPNGEVGVPPSPGSGGGGGIGTGEGGGAGNNTGPGVGRKEPGSGNGPGNGDPNGDGSNGIKGPIDWNRLKQTPNSRDVQIVYKVRAITTPEAQEHKVSGEVVFRLTVDANGVISDVDVVSTVPYMTEAAEAALRKCKFLPATIKGVPVTVRNVIVRIKVGLEERR